MLAPETMHVLLGITVIGVALIAALFLYRRKLNLTGYLWWSVLLILVPILGPILVIAAAPGVSKSPARQTHRAAVR